MSMNDGSPTPESKRTVNLRIAYTALAVACVIGFVNGISGIGRPHASHEKSPSGVPHSAHPLVSRTVQYNLNTATPDESGKLIVPGDETRPTLVLDIPFAANVPDVSAKLELCNPESEGVWVALDEAAVSDMAVFISRNDQAELSSMKNTGQIDFVENGTTATMVKGSRLGEHLVEIQSGPLHGRQVFVGVNHAGEVK